MSESTQVALIPAVEVARLTTLHTAPNGVRYASFGELATAQAEIDRYINAIPATIAMALGDIGWFFVPLAMAEGRAPGAESAGRATGHRERPEETMIAQAYTADLADFAICHRNVELSPEREGIFVSTGLLMDRFSLAFELYINASHAFVDVAGVPEQFSELAWTQVMADVRGETSHDAWDHRAAAIGRGSQGPSETHQAPATEPKPGEKPRPDERARTAYLEAAFSDAVAIYMLSLAIDFDYSELRERDYPLLAPQALADRLRHVHALFPPNPGYEFAVKYRRRG